MTTALDPLLTPEGRALLAELGAREDPSTADPLGLADSLRRRGIDPALAAAALTQIDLRHRARAKLGALADSLILTRDGLEQATRRVISQARARRFLQAGARSVADLGCGIGADSLALADVGIRVLAVDRDEEAARAASENLSPYPHVRVMRADVLDLDLRALRDEGVDALFADPARRTGARGGSSRLLDPESWSPPLSTVLSWRGTIPMVGVKVAPGIAHEALPADAGVEWTSVDGALLEAAIWTGPLALEGAGRRARVIVGDQAWSLAEDSPCPANAPARSAGVSGIGPFIGEPDDAVIRSGLVARLAEDLDAGLVSERIAYLSAERATPTPFLTWFEVCDVVPLKPKAITQALRALDVGAVEVKKRGADVDPQALRAALRLDGSASAVVIATRVNGRHRAIIARRLGPAG